MIYILAFNHPNKKMWLVGLGYPLLPPPKKNIVVILDHHTPYVIGMS
jgi:hypothetical protein